MARAPDTDLPLLSADTDHSFWVPRLAGKTDLIPNHPNTYVDGPARDRALPGAVRAVLRNATCQDAAARLCRRRARSSTAGFKSRADRRSTSDAVSEGRQIFERTACINCHAVGGTGGKRALRPRSDAPDEPRHNRIRRGDRTRRKICGAGFKIPTSSNLDRKCRPWD